MLRPRLRTVRRYRRSWLTLVLVPVIAGVVVGSSTAADPPQLTGQRMDSVFYPCPTDDSVLPLTPSECAGPPATNVTASCDPDGVSTISVTRTGLAFGAPPLLNGTFTETITATIGPQTGPVQPPIFPFGPPSESIGFPSGELLSFESTFAITAGPTTVTGSKTLVPNGGNWGVCREFTDEVTGSGVFGDATLTGRFHILNAGVLSYAADTTGDSAPDETGQAESYLMSTFATCCSSGAPTQVNSASGHLMSALGSTHPATGTSNSVATGVGSAVDVTPLPGVEITFADVTTSGSTTAVQTTTVPALPSGFQVGDPPSYYDLTTTAGFAGPITVCLPYGALPAGTTPALLHYEDGGWVDVTTTFTTTPQVVCGEVTSLSPFAAVGKEPQFQLAGPFSPVDAQDTVNVMKAGRTVPVKFSLGGDFGLNVFASGYPRSEGGACGSDPTDAVETTTTNPTGLQYDAVTGTYQYNWRTAVAWKGQCRELILRFSDGQELRASFRFT